MQAIIYDAPGEPEVLHLGQVPRPPLTADSVRIRVNATAVNRADLLQRRGLYPPPPGASSILGLECAGTVSEVGEAAAPWQVGQRVMALLSGGGYAEEVVVHSGSVLPVPDALTDYEAAAFPEAYLTAFLNIFVLGAPAAGARVLIHGGSSGVGTSAIALCRRAGLITYVTAGSPERCHRCLDLGVTRAINYRSENFADVINQITDGRGVDVILDCIGGAYLPDNVRALAHGGRLICIGTMQGNSGTLDMRTLLKKHLQVLGSTLRARPAPEKAAIIAQFNERFGAALQAAALRPVVDKVYPLVAARDAHARMQAGEHFGKIVLRVRD